MTVAQRLYDATIVTSTTTGTGSYTLGSAIGAAFFDFTDITNGTRVEYTAWQVDAQGAPINGREIGEGTVSSTGTVLSRDVIKRSTNGGSAVNWSAGTLHIAISMHGAAADAAMGAAYDSGYVHITGDGSTTQSIADATLTKVTTTLATVVANGNTWWDTTNKRYLPLKAGIYNIKTSVGIASAGADSAMVALVYKNGAEVGRGTQAGLSFSTNFSAAADVYVSLNGTTDYVESYVFVSQSGGGTNKNTLANATITYFQARFVGV